MEKNIKNKKNVLIFVPVFPVLSETFIARDISKLVELNNLNITVVRLKSGEGEICDNLSDKIYTVNISASSIWNGFFYFFTKTSQTKKAFKIIMQDSSKNFFGKFYLFLKSLAYTWCFAKFSPDEIHVHFLNDSSTIVLVASIILDIPFSINAHARDITQYPTLAVQKAEYAKFITVCNKNAYEYCRKFAEKNTDNIHLIYHGLDKDKLFNYPVTITKDTGQIRIFAGGTRLTAKKGLEYLILASKILKDKNISFRVDIVGMGDLYEKLILLIENNNLKDTIFIHGNNNGLPFSEVSQYYKISDIFVLPIVNTDENDMDGIPNAVIEAALSKLPIITTDAGSVRELIENGSTGIVVAQKDPESIALAIEKLINDENLRNKLGESSYSRAVQMFDADKNVGKLQDLLIK